jgi:hypothetical protein
MDGDWLVVLLGDRELRMPADAEPAVAVLAAASGEPLAVADLAAVADRESRRVLVHRLVREGLLEVLG